MFWVSKPQTAVGCGIKNHCKKLSCIFQLRKTVFLFQMFYQHHLSWCYACLSHVTWDLEWQIDKCVLAMSRFITVDNDSFVNAITESVILFKTGYFSKKSICFFNTKYILKDHEVFLVLRSKLYITRRSLIFLNELFLLYNYTGLIFLTYLSTLWYISNISIDF